MGRATRAAAAGMLLAGLGGCLSDMSASVVTPNEAVATTHAALASEEWMWVAADPFDPFVIAVRPGAPAKGHSVQDAAQALVSNLDSYYKRSGCAAGSASEGTATITLRGCSGPLGGMGLTGTVTVTYAAAGAGVAFSIASKDLKDEFGSIDLDVSGTYTQNGKKRTVAFTDRSIATADGGTLVARNSTGTASWTKGSREVEVVFRGQLQVNGRATTVASSRTLRAARCPAGSTTITRDNHSVSLTFNRNTDATFKDTDGTTQTVGFDCRL